MMVGHGHTLGPPISVTLSKLLRMCLKHRDHILAEDLEHFLNAKYAVEAFDMLDDDKDGKASLKDVRAAVCTIFRCCLSIH